MRFVKTVIPLRNGEFNSAVAKTEGIEALVSDGGAIFKRVLKNGAKTVSKGKIVSYADNCRFAFEGFIERRGNQFSYVKNLN